MVLNGLKQYNVYIYCNNQFSPKLRTVLQIRNWNTPLILTSFCVRNWFRSHIKNVFFFIRETLLYFRNFLTIFLQLSENFSASGYTIKLLLTNCSFHTENVRTLVFGTDVISFGPYVKTAVRIFCCMYLTNS